MKKPKVKDLQEQLAKKDETIKQLRAKQYALAEALFDLLEPLMRDYVDERVNDGIDDWRFR